MPPPRFPFLSRLFIPLLLVCTGAGARGADPVCEAGDPGVEPPVLKPESRVEPDYPEGATARGRVILRLLVDEQGRVAKVEPLRLPYGGDDLGRAADEAVRRWRYRPARRDGGPVACWVAASVEFYPAGPPPPPEPGRGRRKRGRGEDGPGPPAEPPAEAAVERAPPTGAPPEPAGTEARPAAPRPAAPLPDRGQRVIDLARGGPAPLLLGGDAREAAGFLGLETEGDNLIVPDRGLEVTIREGRVAAIRYLYDADASGARPSPFRTRSGLGAGSLCLGIPPAHGRPASREEAGGGLTVLRYELDGVRALFRCRGGRLIEIALESE